MIDKKAITKYIKPLDVCCILFLIISIIIICIYKNTTNKCGAGQFTFFDITIFYNILVFCIIIINRFLHFAYVIHISLIVIQLIFGIFYSLVFFIGCYSEIPFNFTLLYYFIILSIVSYIIIIMYEIRVKFKYGFIDDDSDKPLLPN
jgi:hypothetical protein